MSSESKFSDYWQTLSQPEMKMEKEDDNVPATLFSVRLNLTRTREMKSKTMELCIIFKQYISKICEKIFAS